MVSVTHKHELARDIQMSSPSWTFFPPPSSSHPSRHPQSTSFGFPASSSKLPLAIYFIYGAVCFHAFLVAQMVKNLPAMWQTWVWSLVWNDLLEKGIPWRSPWVRLKARLRDQQTHTFPPTVRERSLFSTPSAALTACTFFDDGHSDWCKVIPHCSFDLLVSNNEQCWASFHVLISHLYVFFGEMSV